LFGFKNKKLVPLETLYIKYLGKKSQIIVAAANNNNKNPNKIVFKNMPSNS